MPECGCELVRYHVEVKADHSEGWLSQDGSV